MAAMFDRVKRVYHRGGLIHLLARGSRYVYDNTVRPYLPRRATTYNSVRVPAARILDPLVPGVETEKPDYESALVTAVEAHVEVGDAVTIIGGGWGVTAATAARNAGPNGEVAVFEGSRRSVAHVRETAAMNGLDDRISVTHAIVGDDRLLGVYDPTIRASTPREQAGASDARVVDPTELPDCDVLELDCEGAEADILREMSIRPRAIVVETHGHLGSPREEIEGLLSEMAYDVVSVGAEDERNDVYILAAVRRSD